MEYSDIIILRLINALKIYREALREEMCKTPLQYDVIKFIKWRIKEVSIMLRGKKI